jgi:hypothetical protein
LYMFFPHVLSSLAYLNLLGNKRLDCCCCCNNSAPGTSLATVTSPNAFGRAFGSTGWPRSFLTNNEGQI